MNKLRKILCIICILAWLGVLLIAVFKPLLNYRTALILASLTLIITYIFMFFDGSEQSAGQTEEFNTEQRRDTKPNNKSRVRLQRRVRRVKG